MSIRTLNQAEANQVAVDYITTRSKPETYKRFNPGWDKLKAHSVRCNTYDLFHQPLVKHTIMDIQSNLLETTMKNLGLSMDTQLQLLIDVIAEARAAKQYGAVGTFIKDQNHLLKLYDIASEDAVKLDMTVARPAKKNTKTTH